MQNGFEKQRGFLRAWGVILRAMRKCVLIFVSKTNVSRINSNRKNVYIKSAERSGLSIISDHFFGANFDGNMFDLEKRSLMGSNENGVRRGVCPKQ